MHGEFHITLLGGFAIHRGEQVIRRADFERRSGAELLQLLSLSPHRRLHREQVLDALWPDAPIESSTNRLHKAATYVRKALGVNTGVVLRGEVVELLPEAEVTIDVSIVATASLDDQHQVAAALDLCGGELLPELPYEDWLTGPREAHRRRHAALLEKSGRWRELIELDPANELPYLRLLSEMIQVGDRAAALSVYDELEAALLEHQGVAPSSAATDMRDQAEQMSAGLFLTTVRGGSRLREPAIGIIGREAEMAELGSAVQATRLVTVVGAGGSGKTHLARHVAARLSDSFDDGVWVCEFGTIDGESGVEQQLLQAIGAQRHADATVVESIVRSLATRSTLIVLDNCEHLAVAVARLVATILASCPGAHILATSRRPLGIEGELLRPTTALDRAAAIELFCVRAQQHGVTLNPSDPAIGGICKQLDDLPLALELAAARTRSLSVAEIESLLDNRFEYLRATAVPTLDHHQTLEASIAWSIDALDPTLHQAIADLSVFANHFSLEAATAIANRHGATEVVIADQLDELVQRSLVQRVAHSDGPSEFRLLESVRLFARALPAGSDASERHLDYFVERFERMQADRHVRPTEVLLAFAREWDDIRAAFGHAMAADRRDDAVRLVDCCGVFSLLTMRFEFLDWAEALFGDSPKANTPTEARVIASWAALLGHRSDYIRGQELALLAHTAAPADDRALIALSWSRAAAGDVERASELVSQVRQQQEPTHLTMLGADALGLLIVLNIATGTDPTPIVDDLQLYASTGDDIYRMVWLFGLGCSQMRTDPRKAIASLDESILLSDAMGIDLSSMASRSLRAVGSSFVGPTLDALTSIRDTLSWAAERGMWSSTLNDFTTAAIVLQRAERPDVAITLLAAREHSGFARGFGSGRTSLIDRLRAAHPDKFSECWNRGERLDAKTATNFALMTMENLIAESTST